MATAFYPNGKMSKATDKEGLKKGFENLAATVVGPNGCRPDPCNRER